MQQIQNLHAKQTRNRGRTELRITASVRKIMTNERNKKYKITSKQNFSTNMRSGFRNLKQE